MFPPYIRILKTSSMWSVQCMPEMILKVLLAMIIVPTHRRITFAPTKKCSASRFYTLSPSARLPAQFGVQLSFSVLGVQSWFGVFFLH